MGNSSSSPSNHTHSHQPYHPAAYHREIRSNGHLHYPTGPPPHMQPHQFNPEYKVLPERIPGQKLRLTDNGAILQSGGTISGKPGMQGPPHNDLEFLRALNRRPDGGEDRRSFGSNSRHYSNPDLLQQISPHDMHGYETDGGSSSHRRNLKKNKAPPPPLQMNNSIANQTNTYRDPVTGMLIKINPWEQRQESKCVGVPSQMRSVGSMERILEHHEVRNNSATDWRFYRRIDQTKPTAFNDDPGRNGYVGSIDRHRPVDDRPFRAKSMDSLQLPFELHRPVGNKFRQSLENLDKSISIEQQNGIDRRRRMRGSQENLHIGIKLDEGRRSSSRQSSMSTSSLNRPHLISRIVPQKEMKLLTRERSSTSSAGRVGSPVTKTEIMLKRKDSNSTPKQYYFGDGMTNNDPQPTPPSDTDRWLYRSNSGSAVYKSEMKSGGSRQSGGGRSMLSQQEIPVKKGTTPPERPESRNSQTRDVTSTGVPAREGHPSHDSTFLHQVPKGRQRNSYAFEDTRYRYELETCETINKPLLQLSLDNPEDDDINMHLRPTLPKRVPALPRFSPTQAWRSLNLEHIISNAQQGSEVALEGVGGDVLEDCIHRVTRPVAPPRIGNERSADSGISQDAGSPGLVNDFEMVVAQEKSKIDPPATNISRELSLENNVSTFDQKRSAWTPEEDLASDFDGGSNEHPGVSGDGEPQMVSVQPKLMSMKSMFSSKLVPNIEDSHGQKGIKKLWVKPNDSNSPHTFNSMRKLKRSSSGAAGEDELDENWSFSHSLPTSLHNGHEGEKVANKQTNDSTPNFRMRRAGSGPIAQSPVVLGLQNRVMSLDSLNPYTRMNVTNAGVVTNQEQLMKYSPSQHIIYLPEYDAKKIIIQKESPSKEELGNVIYVGSEPKKSKKFTFQSTVRQHERRRLEQKLSQVAEQDEKLREREKLLGNRVEEEFQKKRAREKASICNQLKILTDSSTPSARERENGILGSETPPPPLMPATQLYYYNGEAASPTSPVADNSRSHCKLEKQDSGFFSGISKWMRRQQKLEEQEKTSRQEPDGAPSTHNQNDANFSGYKSHLNEQRDFIVNSSRFSSGEVFIDTNKDITEQSTMSMKSRNEELALHYHHRQPSPLRTSRGQPLCPKSSIEDSDRSSEVEDNEPKRHSRYRSPGSSRKQNGYSTQVWSNEDVVSKSSEKKLSR